MVTYQVMEILGASFLTVRERKYKYRKGESQSKPCGGVLESVGVILEYQ